MYNLLKTEEIVVQFTLVINQKKAIEFGLNASQALVFDMLTKSALWAETVLHGDSTFYWVARQKIQSELPLLDLNLDTIYRFLKHFDKIGILIYTKIGKKDCIKITPKGAEYIFGESAIKVGLKSEFGNKSENDSDLNPTYQSTNTNQHIYTEIGFDDSDPDADLLAEWIDNRVNKKMGMTRGAYKRMVNALNCAEQKGFNRRDALGRVIDGNWKSLQVAWLENSNAKRKQTTTIAAKWFDLDQKF